MSRARNLFKSTPPSARNREGYPAYLRPLEERYLQVLMTNTLDNTFYASKESLLLESNDLHGEMMAADPDFAARAIVYARQQGLMKLQPILGLAFLSAVDRSLFARIFDQVVLIPSDLADFLTILDGLGRGQGGRAVKRSAAAYLNQITEYWALKYNGRGRGFSLGDAVATAHPVPVDDRQGELFRYVTGQSADLRYLPQIAAFEDLKRASSDEERIEAITRGRLPHEIVTGAIKPSPAIWQALLDQMPLFALLRNLNTMKRSGVLEDNREYIVQRLSDPGALQKSKILPFRFLTAYDRVEAGWLRDALRGAVELTFANLPEIPGRSAIFLDISGSMEGQYLRIGGIFALSLFKKSGGQSIFWLFDTEVADARASMHDSILSQAERIQARGGTDTGAPMRKLRKSGIKVDNIILITDEQQNTGRPFYTELTGYRSKVNAEARAFIIDIAPYQTAIVPPADLKTSYIFGWSDTVLHYIARSCAGYQGMIDEVRNLII